MRSVASSRVRWAIVIDSVLAITKLPDEQRDAAEREQEVLEDVEKAARVLRRLLRLLPDRSCTWAFGGSSGWISRDQLLPATTPWRGGDVDRVELALLVEDLLGRRAA